MPEIDPTLLQFEVQREWFDADKRVDPQEEYFWQHGAQIEETYLHEFFQQPGYAENVKFVTGPLFDVVPYLTVGDEVPEEVRKEAGRKMAEWYVVPATYPLPNNAGINIQMVCSIRWSQAHLFDASNLEELTKDAIVFNTRFQIGGKFSYEQFLTAFTKFLERRGIANAKKIKIAVWEHDLIENAAERHDGDELSLRDLPKFSVQLAASIAKIPLIALEIRTMSDAERARQKRIHSSEPTSDELARINSILTGSEDSL